MYKLLVEECALNSTGLSPVSPPERTTPQHLQPFPIPELPQCKLWRLVLRLKQLPRHNIPQMVPVGFIRNAVLGQRLLRELQQERLTVQPYCCLSAS